MVKSLVIATLGNDPHTLGLFRVARAARRAGVEVQVLPPGTSLPDIAAAVRDADPGYLGFSYRLSPEVALREFAVVLGYLGEQGLLRRVGAGLRQVALAGLPETMRALGETPSLLPCKVVTMPEVADRAQAVRHLLGFLEIPPAEIEAIIDGLADELNPPRIHLLDQLASDVVASDYAAEPPLPAPSMEARGDYLTRIREADLPLLRTHFGIPAPTIRPTIEGIRALAEAGAVDEVSLGSSDLSQRYFGQPEAFESRKNDGGVPYKTFEDLVALFEASRRGNFPSMKPYAHVVDLVGFIDTCLRAGMLVGAHQAVPLYWFNELDGRGPMTVAESIVEHAAAVRELARRGLPVEMNDPNQWSSRWAHDAAFCADYGLITSVMLQNGVRDLVLQMQFNKPRETGDFADLAKMTAALELAGQLLPAASSSAPEASRPGSAQLWRETRTGIDSFDPDLDVARWQLARSTLLQMMVSPHVIHLVSYCEAVHIANPADVIDSSKLVRRAVRVFRQHQDDLLPYLQHDKTKARRAHLLGEAETLLRAIAALDTTRSGGRGASRQTVALPALVPSLAEPKVLTEALERGYIGAPGIFLAKYPLARSMTTGPVKDGAIDCLDPETGKSISEATRLAALGAALA